MSERCFYCGINPGDGIDHVIPISKGGDNRPSNMVWACRSCNSSKGPRTPEQWLMSLRKRAAECNHACPRCCGSASVNPMGDHQWALLGRLESVYGQTV